MFFCVCRSEDSILLNTNRCVWDIPLDWFAKEQRFVFFLQNLFLFQLPSVLPFAMENVLAASENSALCTDIRKEMKEIARRQNKASDWSERKVLQAEFRQLRKELKQREKKAKKKKREEGGVLLRQSFVFVFVFSFAC